ncbi:hypothetical protein CN907_08425 [Bacillus anthracis]|nr:hypothetical protein CN907_08425 [Bacillus anthracis]
MIEVNGLEEMLREIERKLEWPRIVKCTATSNGILEDHNQFSCYIPKWYQSHHIDIINNK